MLCVLSTSHCVDKLLAHLGSDTQAGLYPPSVDTLATFLRHPRSPPAPPVLSPYTPEAVLCPMWL